MSFKGFSSFLLWWPFCSAEHYSHLKEGHPRNNSVKLFLNRAIGLGDVI